MMFRLEKHTKDRCRLLLAYADSAHAVQCGRHFRRLGWEVRLVASAAEAQRLVQHYVPNVIVLDVDLADESGWLTCAKITAAHKGQRVYLLVPERTAEAQKGLAAAGAAGLLSRQDSMESLLETLLDQRLAQAV